MRKLFLIAFLLFLSSCFKNIEYNYPENPENIRKKRGGKFFDDINLFKNKSSDLKNNDDLDTILINSNNVLFNAAAEVVGSILPIALIDSKSGIIISEWYQDGKDDNSRIKINLIVKLNDKIIMDNLSLTIFKQKRENGQWIDDKSLDQNITSDLIKEKIISKAKTYSKSW